MPPGRHRSGPRNRMRINGATFTTLLNAEAQNEEEIKNKVRWFFGSWMVAVLIIDLGSALSVVWLSCNRNVEGFSSRWQCVEKSVFTSSAFRYIHPGREDGYEDTLGDFVVLSMIRCLLTFPLLWIGIRFGKERKPTTENSESSRTEEESSLSEPLLAVDHPDQEDPPLVSSQGSTELNFANEEASIENPSVANESWKKCTDFWTPPRIQKLVLILILVSCTLYQIYAGLRVATMQVNQTSSTLRIVLLCSTILWINAEAYLANVLVVELTRNEEGLLFLPPEIHRHPLYLETNNRTMAMHQCDLCHQRIGERKQKDAVCRPARMGGRTKASTTTYCYRCSLCDFDICMACSRRNDAATVGENVLRGDRGVRAEISLTTSEYIRRSIKVAGKSEWPWLLVSFTLLAISSLTKLFLPHFQGKIIDKVIPIPYHPNSDIDPDEAHYDKNGFVKYIGIYILVMVAQGAFSTLYSAIFTLVSRRLKFTIRNALLEKILAQDVAYFDGTESGRLLSRLTNDLDMMMAPIQSSLSNLLSNSLVLVGGMTLCFAKSYRLSMLAFVTVGPISYLWEQYALWSRGLAREMLSHWAQGNSISAQALSHIRTVKAFGCEDFVLNEYSKTNKMALDCGVKDAWGNAVTSALTGYLDLGTGVLILYFGGLLVYRGEMTVGDLVTYQLFWNMMNSSYQSLQGLVTSFTRSAAGAEKVFSLWDSHPDIDPSIGNDVCEEDICGHIQLQNVKFYYQMRPDNIVLEDFHLDIPAGKTLALVGRSGGGKSTIINLLLRFYDPKNGRILLDGMPYESLKVHQLRRLFGVVTQETELFAATIEENIAYGLDPHEYTFEDVVEASKKAYAHEFICQMKDGYQTRIGEKGSRISGGQRQRLAIARVFLRKPKIILLDEATSALDEASQQAVQTALGDLIRESNATVVMVAHRLSTVIHADSICVIDRGRVLEQGNHEELLKIPNGVYASMVSKQTTKAKDLLDQDDLSKDRVRENTIDDLWNPSATTTKRVSKG